MPIGLELKVIERIKMEEELNKLKEFLKIKGYKLDDDISNFIIKDMISLYFEFIKWKKNNRY